MVTVGIFRQKTVAKDYQPKPWNAGSSERYYSLLNNKKFRFDN